ncbi:MAG: hypothetical protein FJX76_20140 [Armatimonadetes bacterium]|nr:hypothetical protein [Armatimonadota bacterium]
MGESLAVARLTLLELSRRQLAWVTVFFAVVLAVIPQLIGAFGMTGFERVSKDACLTLLGWFAIGIALLLAATAVPGDVERRTVYPLLARPMSRDQYLVGKFLGLAAWIAGSVMLCGAAIALGCGAISHALEARLLVGAALEALKACVLAAVTLLFATRTGPVAAGIAALAVYIIAGLSDAYVGFFLEGEGVLSLAAWLVRAVKTVLPDFEVFHLKNALVHDEPLRFGYLAALAAYGLAWISGCLLAAGLVFGRHDL